MLGFYRGLYARKMDSPETAICTLERQRARLPVQRVIHLTSATPGLKAWKNSWTIPAGMESASGLKML